MVSRTAKVVVALVTFLSASIVLPMVTSPTASGVGGAGMGVGGAAAVDWSAWAGGAASFFLQAPRVSRRDATRPGTAIARRVRKVNMVAPWTQASGTLMTWPG